MQVRSPVWGDVPRDLLASHGQRNTWGADYSYATAYGLDGKSHPGVDIAMPAGTPLRAIRAGRVATIRQESYGTREVVIEDARGERQLYTHTSAQSVKVGDTVTVGQVIAHSGDPGSGAHLHFEHRVKDSGTSSGWRIVDPLPLLTGSTTTPTYTEHAPVLGETLGTPDAWIAWAEAAGVKRVTDFAAYARELYRLCRIAGMAGPQAHKLLCQWHLETGGGTSRWWAERLNPAGLGITGDPEQNETSKFFVDGVDAARAHFHHLYQYATWPLPEWVEVYRASNPRADAVPVGVRGTKQTLADFGSVDPQVVTWARDADYGAKWAARLNALAPVFAGGAEPEQPEQPEPDRGGNGMKKHDWSSIGFREPVWLPSDIEVLIRIIPSSTPGWTSGQKLTGQTKTTWHDTGNPNSSALSEYRWAADGGRAGINSPGSYNGIFDAYRIIITQRFDELVGHAGVPTGNRQAWAFEQAFGPAGGGFDAGLRVGAALHGGIIAAKGWQVDTSLVQHRYWSGKWCPGQILNRGIWSQVVKMTSDAAAKARAAASGNQPAPYPAPVPIPELEAYKGKPQGAIPYRVDGDGWTAFAVFDRVKATKATPRYRYSSGGTDRTGPDIPAGLEFDVDWLLISETFPDTYLSPWNTRVRAADTVRVADVKADE